MHLEITQIAKLGRSDDELEIPVPCKSLFKKSVGPSPAVSTLPVRPTELEREPTQFKHELAEDRRRDA